MPNAYTKIAHTTPLSSLTRKQDSRDDRTETKTNTHEHITATDHKGPFILATRQQITADLYQLQAMGGAMNAAPAA